MIAGVFELEKGPDICDAEMVKWTKTPQHSLISPRSRGSFADCHMKVFKERRMAHRKEGPGGNNKTPGMTV